MLTALFAALALTFAIIALRGALMRARTAAELKTAEARAASYRLRALNIEGHLRDLATFTGHRIVTRGAEIVAVVKKARVEGAPLSPKG